MLTSANQVHGEVAPPAQPPRQARLPGQQPHLGHLGAGVSEDHQVRDNITLSEQGKLITKQ